MSHEFRIQKTHRIHGTGIFIYMFGLICLVNVGKQTIPMNTYEPMGNNQPGFHGSCDLCFFPSRLNSLRIACIACNVLTVDFLIELL